MKLKFNSPLSQISLFLYYNWNEESSRKKKKSSPNNEKLQEILTKNDELLTLNNNLLKASMTKRRNKVCLKLELFCKYCRFKCSKKSVLQCHVNSVHLKLKPFSCRYCEFKFARKSDLQSHVNSVHLKIQPFSCIGKSIF